MTFKICNDLTLIENIHKKIFNNEFPMESMKQKLLKGYIVNPIVFLIEDEIVGYALVIEDRTDNSLRAWVGGILPHWRGHGLIGLFFDWLLEYGKNHAFNRIKCSTDNFKPEMIVTLVKRGYSIVGLSESNYGDKKKIKFEKKILRPHNIRIGITNICNYNCFFCHREGVKLSENFKMPLPDIGRILIQANKLSIKEITITGGEPFLYPEAVFFILRMCSKWIYPPVIKIDTNGSMLSPTILEQLIPYRGLIRLHISFHSLDMSRVREIYGTMISMEHFKKLFDWLDEGRFKYRINYVLLEGLNATAPALNEVIKYCLRKHIPSINMMEMLIKKNQSNLLPYYVSSDTICRRLESICDLSITQNQKNEKKTTYIIHTENNELEVSVYRLSCRIGCLRCAEDNDIMIGADAACHPCYLEPEIAIDSLYPLEEMICKREDFIQKRGFDFSKKALYWGM